MLDEILRIMQAALVPLAAVVLVLALRSGRGPRLLCPGRRTRLWRANPTRWFLRFGCRYDLTGLRADAAGLTICPECGRHSGARQRVRQGGAVRVAPLAAAVLLLCLASIGLRASRGGLARCVPTLALVALQRGPARLNPRPLREELSTRVYGNQLGPWLAGLVSRSLAGQIRNDNRRWNASDSEWMLDSLWPASQHALESALVSGDTQARVIAARVLRRRIVGSPSEALLRASVEDLRLRPPDLDWYIGLHRVSNAAMFLVDHAALAEELLAEALDSGDPQQRLVAAGVAGFGRRVALLPKAAPILIEHLRDNRIGGDAKIAAPALYHFGPAVVPFLEPYFDDGDAQRRGLARAIAEVLAAPDRSNRRLDNPAPQITEITSDPIRGLPLYSGICDLSWPAEQRAP